MLAFWDDENFHSLVATAAVGLLVLVIFLGVPYSILWCIRWFLKWVFKGPATSTRGSQTEERPADHDGGPEAKDVRTRSSQRSMWTVAQSFAKFSTRGAVKLRQWAKPSGK